MRLATIPAWLVSFSILIGLPIALGCSPSAPTEKDALQRCQSIARGEMKNVVGNPRYRRPKSKISFDDKGSERFEFTVKDEYFYKDQYSGDSELRFTCSIAKNAGDDQWTTLDFDSICVGGCS